MQIEYDLALSFAGEERTIAKQIAETMLCKNYKVYYDDFEPEKTFGENLTVVLGEIYGEKSKFCLIVISKSYVEKSWTYHELQFALSKQLKQKNAYILPLKVDDSELPGFSPLIGYIDLRNSSVPIICDLLTKKIGVPFSLLDANRVNKKDDKKLIQDVLSACYRRAVFTRYHAQLNHEAMFESLADCRVQLQKLIAYLEDDKNQSLVSGIIGELDYIERVNNAKFTWDGSGTMGSIDGAKLRIIKSLYELSNYSNLNFVMPKSLTEEVFWNKKDAYDPPVGHETDEYLIGGGGGFKG